MFFCVLQECTSTTSLLPKFPRFYPWEFTANLGSAVFQKSLSATKLNLYASCMCFEYAVLQIPRDLTLKRCPLIEVCPKIFQKVSRWLRNEGEKVAISNECESS